MASTPAAERGHLWPAVCLFSVDYLLLSALVTAVLISLDLNSNTGVSVAVLFAATAAAAHKFVTGHARPLCAASSCGLRSWPWPRRC